MSKSEVCCSGASMGNVLALVISYVKYKSIGWAIIHSLFSWFYVIYYIIKF